MSYLFNDRVCQYLLAGGWDMTEDDANEALDGRPFAKYGSRLPGSYLYGKWVNEMIGQAEALGDPANTGVDSIGDDKFITDHTQFDAWLLTLIGQNIGAKVFGTVYTEVESTYLDREQRIDGVDALTAGILRDGPLASIVAQTGAYPGVFNAQE